MNTPTTAERLRRRARGARALARVTLAGTLCATLSAPLSAAEMVPVVCFEVPESPGYYTCEILGEVTGGGGLEGGEGVTEGV